MSHRFTARLYRQGILRCLDVPGRVSEHLGVGHVAVSGTVEGMSFQSTLAPRGDGLHRLFVHSRIFKARGVDSGDLVEVELEYDPEPEAAVPPELADALAGAPESEENFHALTPARRREVIRYVESAKRDETRARRVAEIVGRLLTDLRPRTPPLLD